MRKHAHREHFNHRGVPCHCPWGEGSKDPEHLGSIKQASKLEWLQGRPDMQTEEAKEFLNTITGGNSPRTNYSDADKLLPWIAREWKKRRLVPHKHYPNMLTYSGGGGEGRFFTPDEATEAVGLLEKMQNHRQGLDVMQHKAHELIPKINDFRDWLKERDRERYGEILHRYNDGWTVRQLQNAEEARVEGEDMGHCVKAHGKAIENGHDLIISLRDHRNLPHATMQLYPDHWENSITGEVYDHGEHRPAGVKLIPRVGSGSEVEQFYGKEDSPPLQEYTDRMNDWLHPTHGIAAETFEPWWDTTYEARGPETLNQFWDYLDGNYHEYAPDDYQSAMSDAEEHGMEGPDLVPGAYPDWGSILSDMVEKRVYTQGRGYHNEQIPYDQDEGQRLLDHVTGEERGRWHSLYTEGEHPEDLKKNLQDLNAGILNDSPFSDAHHDDEALADAWSQDSRAQMVDHLLPQLDESYVPPFQQANPIHPQQSLLFHPNDPANLPWSDETWVQEHFGSTTGRPPLYYRWSFTPEHGVMLSSNDDDHPSRVPYHRDMGGSTQGYAYRIGDGWRLTNGEHGAIEDPFIVAQVMRALVGKDGLERASSEGWQPTEYDWDRTHYGLPLERLRESL